MIYYNNGTLRGDFKNIYYNNGALRDVKQVWWNINGTPKMVWPDGVYTNHRDWFNGGIFHTDNRTNDHGYIEDGRASVGSSDFSFSASEYKADNDSDLVVWAWAYPWFLTKDKVNLSLYSKLIVSWEYITWPYFSNSGNDYGRLSLYFITSSVNSFPSISNNWSMPSGISKSKTIASSKAAYNTTRTETFTIDINDITEENYIGFYINGCNYSGYREGSGGNGKLTQIELVR